MRKAALTALALVFLHGAGAQAFELPADAPLPEPRPYAPLDKASAVASIPFSAGLLLEKNLATLKEGLDALARGDAADAMKARDAAASGSLDRHILSWAIAMSGAAPSAEITAAADELSGWPGLARLRANGERALYRENPPARDVVAAFADTSPTTYYGTVALARAHVALGDVEAARAVLSPFWRDEKLEAAQETAILKEFGDLIAVSDHRHRMERMLYEDRIRSAERVAARAGAEALTKAWAAVIRGEKNAGKLLEAVPADQRSAGYHFAKARYLRRAGKFDEAAKAILAAPRDASMLIDADEWWFERRVLSRELLDHGDPRTAYRVAAAHSGGSEASRADAAFHAGWYALRELKEPETASRHFARIAEIADGPISKARAYYWLARAADAGGPGSAVAYYEQAAAYGTAFYGQLAAAHLGRSTISARSPEPTATDRKTFAAREAVHAIERLERAGGERWAGMLYRDLARELSSTGELALLAAKAERRGDHYLALRMGKIAAGRGLDIGALAHPLGAIPEKASISGAGKALAYAIARQESEFNAGAVSGAGARGLLQLMPATARSMAKKEGLPFSATRLTSDAGYNATLGAAYLSEQLERFDGSYILTFVGYNAGPGRANDWIERYGDPRGQPIEAVVDWIERIPFTETRNYVQRVMENYQVYKMRLTGRFDIVNDLVDGRG
ncbi:lytic transglycosylase domain-containing protein [Chelativorans sp. AA-79]|uniref:lytic transglycosylase domain-containing protein n=1 Tax=Chelativorans sp. AA-79 TaxID=3028735 RepID=UPI0023F834D9|nr:lytic transglycosylase domain-containing protein [Chelativorans sp. AA-79]WEX07679.1 lytic transglycosylase domain-containing protein [Chelativorans sp. AA-79]